MIIMVNKNGHQPVPLGDRDSYYNDFKTNNLPKGEKGKQEIPAPTTCL